MSRTHFEHQDNPSDASAPAPPRGRPGPRIFFSAPFNISVLAIVWIHSVPYRTVHIGRAV